MTRVGHRCEAKISALLADGLQKPGDAEDRLGSTLAKLAPYRESVQRVP